MKLVRQFQVQGEHTAGVTAGNTAVTSLMTAG